MEPSNTNTVQNGSSDLKKSVAFCYFKLHSYFQQFFSESKITTKE